MNRALAALIASATTFGVLHGAPITPEQTLSRRSIGDLEFSPDGSRLAFTVTEPVKATERPRSLWLLDVAAGAARPLTFSGKSDSSPRWAPDGESIAFLSDRDGTAQLYLLSMRGGEAERLTTRKDAINAFRWSPDGSRIALLMAEAKTDAQVSRERDKDDGRRVDADRRQARVWILDVASRRLVQATSGSWQIAQIEWIAGDRLVAAAAPAAGSDRWTERIYEIDLTHDTDATFRELAAPRGPFAGLTPSPDGHTLAYVGARVDGPEPHDLCTFDLTSASKTSRNLTGTTIDRPISQVRWIDNGTVAALVATGFKTGLATIAGDGRARMLATEVNPTAFARAKDGTFALAGETAVRAPELWIIRPEGTARAVTTVNAGWSSIPAVKPEFVKYKSADGVEVEAALLRPSGDRAERPSATIHEPFPFVILVHGGPTGRWSDTFEPWGQLLAQRGYAVLYPNIRGSVGYGQRFVEANRGDWGGGDFKDVMAGVDWAIANGIADPNRLGIGGWSYGGYMAAWAVTQTTRFKAAVSGAPVIDLASEFGTENGPAYDEWFYGTPYERLDGFIKSSPITYVKNVKTPTLLLQGEDDTTDPIGQSQQFYRGLKRYGVDTELVLYPREPHGFREEKHLLDRLTRILAWYDKYLKPASAPTSHQ